MSHLRIMWLYEEPKITIAYEAARQAGVGAAEPIGRSDLESIIQ